MSRTGLGSSIPTSAILRLPPLLGQVVTSISTVPTLATLGFIGLGLVQLHTAGRPAPQLPAWLARFDIQDLDTVRSVLTAVIGGVFTLTIFAYTMVMSVINSAISSYSPRLLKLIISQRYHQAVMGIGLGTIAHAVVLLLGVASGQPGVAHPPVLAAASSATFAIVCVWSYIFFINRVSHGIQINEILRASYEFTSELIGTHIEQAAGFAFAKTGPPDLPHRLRAKKCGYLASVDLRGLARQSENIGSDIVLLPAPGSFVAAGEPLFAVPEGLSPKHARELLQRAEVSFRDPINVYETGFKHQVEVAAKAMSSALNDPGTALTALHYLEQLFRELADVRPYNQAVRGGGRLWLHRFTQIELADRCFAELHAYLDADPWTGGLLAEVERRVRELHGGGE